MKECCKKAVEQKETEIFERIIGFRTTVYRQLRDLKKSQHDIKSFLDGKSSGITELIDELSKPIKYKRKYTKRKKKLINRR